MQTNMLFADTQKNDNYFSLAILASQLDGLTSTLLMEFSLLPKPFDQILEDHYRNRSQAKTVGLFIPWVIADMVGFVSIPKMKKLIPSWLLLHAYILLVDDLVDEEASVNHFSLQIASGLLLQKSLSNLFSLVPSAIQSIDKINEYFNETAVAVNTEISAVSGKPDPKELYKKMSIFKVWMFFLLYSEDRYEEIPHTESIIIFLMDYNYLMMSRIGKKIGIKIGIVLFFIKLFLE